MNLKRNVLSIILFNVLWLCIICNPTLMYLLCFLYYKNVLLCMLQDLERKDDHNIDSRTFKYLYVLLDAIISWQDNGNVIIITIYIVLFSEQSSGTPPPQQI